LLFTTDTGSRLFKLLLILLEHALGRLPLVIQEFF
jgi:hypothetical protein